MNFHVDKDKEGQASTVNVKVHLLLQSRRQENREDQKHPSCEIYQVQTHRLNLRQLLTKNFDTGPFAY